MEQIGKEELFAAAPRRKGEVAVAGKALVVYEMTVYDRLQFLEFTKANQANTTLCHAWLVQRCAPVLQGMGFEQVMWNLSSELLLAAFITIQDLSAREAGLGEDMPAEDGAEKKP